MSGCDDIRFELLKLEFKLIFDELTGKIDSSWVFRTLKNEQAHSEWVNILREVHQLLLFLLKYYVTLLTEIFVLREFVYQEGELLDCGVYVHYFGYALIIINNKLRNSLSNIY